MRKSIIGAACACLAVVSFSANAAVISYDENTSSDLSLREHLGSLDAGLNTVSGTTSVSGYDYDFDGFTFTVLNGNQVDSIYIDYVSTSNLDVIFTLVKFPNGVDFGFETIADMTLGAKLEFSSPSIPHLTSDTDIISYFSLGALPTGEYGLLGSGINSDGSYGELQYTWGMNVSVVPVPAAVWLFGSGLIGLVGLARRNAYV